MKFSELPMGAKFRLFRIGPVSTKTRKDQMDGDIDVIHLEEEGAPPAPPPPAKAHDITFVKGGVWLEGMFDAEQLEAVLAALKKKRR